MIYIFDDKKNRQEGYGWTKNKFAQYANFVHPIYQYNDVQEETERQKVFSDNNVVLFHESFFDADFNKHDKDSLKIRKDLEAFAQDNTNFYLAFFSGSKNVRSLNNNVAYLPVSILYQNLEEFILQSENKNVDLKYLLYGKNPNKEKELVEKLNAANNALEINELPKIDEERKILIARTNTSNRLHQIIVGAHYSMNLSGDTVEEIYEATIKHLQEKYYEKIFIPLCFGASLSDFNGLRLAAFIRCTATINQCTPAYIYSFVKIDEIINHECFNILKTKNVYLIDHTVNAFIEAINSKPEPLELSELPKEIAKLKLDVPDNYEDSHSIANEWAIYRWAKAIDLDERNIQKIIEKVNSELYFKYLRTIYPASEMPEIGQQELQLPNLGQPKILYVDDDAEKGWYEILCTILSDINGINSIDYLGDDLKKVSQKEIIEKTIRKIREDDIDLVILDFRLHPDDFTATNIKDVTGFKLLQDIKKINSGIQIIIFSATTKIWNLQALQDVGANGFIIKESPDNSINPSLTKDTIMSFKSSIEAAIKKRFLKEFFIICETILQQLNNCDTEPGTIFDDFIKDLKSHIKLIQYSANKIDLKTSMTLDVVFLNCYNFMEKFKQHYLHESGYHQVLGLDEIEMNRYSYHHGVITNQGRFIRNGINDSPSWFNTMAGLFIDYFQIADINDDSIEKLNRIKDQRNDYIHGAKNKFDQNELLMAMSLCAMITSDLRE